MLKLKTNIIVSKLSESRIIRGKIFYKNEMAALFVATLHFGHSIAGGHSGGRVSESIIEIESPLSITEPGA